MNLRANSAATTDYQSGYTSCCSRRCTTIQMESGPAWNRANWSAGCSKTDCLSGWGCSCIRSCGTPPCAAFSLDIEGKRFVGKVDAIVLLSGGMDSCVSAAEALHAHGRGRVGLLHASYGQRTEAREQRAFSEIAEFYGVKEKLLARLDYFRCIGGLSVTDSMIAVPENDLGAPGPRRSAIPVTYVPFRNALLL